LFKKKRIAWVVESDFFRVDINEKICYYYFIGLIKVNKKGGKLK